MKQEKDPVEEMRIIFSRMSYQMQIVQSTKNEKRPYLGLNML